MKYIILSAVILMSSAAYSGEEDVNYCHDETVNKDWKERVEKFPLDPIIVKLAGLREGLCAMIDRGDITFDFGNDVFNLEHERAIVERQNDEQYENPKYTL